MKKICCYLLWSITLLLFSAHNFAQRIHPNNSYDIFRQIKQLNHLTHILYLAAHPDDENTRLLAYFVHEKNYKTSYLSLTRGEGGQNLIGQELGLGLGLIRNYELNAARDIDGASQLFSSTIDFGFSKTPEETFTFWDKEKIIKETRDIIQLIKPDVIICRFPTTGEGGHGQHTASAIIGLEAFNRTIQDKNAFHPQRILFNAFKFGNRSTIKDGQFHIDIQQYQPGLGLSTGQLSGISRSIHRSQGVGTPQIVGIEKEYFEVMAGEAIIHDLIDRDISWNRVQAPQITALVDKIIQDYDFTAPYKSIPALIQLKKVIEKDVKDTFWKEEKIKDIDNLLIHCSGLMLEALSAIPETTPESNLSIKLNAIARSPQISIQDIQWNNASLMTSIALTNDELFTTHISLKIPAEQPITQPFWLSSAHLNSHYQYEFQHALDNRIVNYPELNVVVNIQGEILTIPLPLSYKYLHPLRGDVIEFLRVTPPVVINPIQDVLFLKPQQDNTLDIKLKYYQSYSNMNLLILNQEQSKVLHQIPLPAITPLKDTIIQVTIPKNIQLPSTIICAVKSQDDTYTAAQHYIKYDHIPELVYYTPAQVKIVHPEWHIPQQRIAYIHGAGDKIPETLKNIGLNVDVLPAATLNQSKVLATYNTIILGIRAYNTLEDMPTYMDQLLQYVHQGGRVIVQYNTSNNLLTQVLGPYPFTISRDRVTEENATVTFINPHDPILNTPHRITAQDFDGWVQERGLYFPTDIDTHYNLVLQMHDTGEAPLNSALMYTRYGKGIFVYTGLSFFRQIPVGHTGAIKLLINCIELK